MSVAGAGGTATPAFAGISHVSLSVRDRDMSVAWYSEVLGFRPFEEVKEHDYEEWVLVHPENRMVLCLQQHTANAGDEFDPTRTGSDHLALKVGARADLDDWSRWFDARGVEHSAVVEREYGSVLCFRDPDRIQLELFYRDGHP